MRSSEVQRFSRLSGEAFAREVAQAWRAHGWTVVNPRENAAEPAAGADAVPDAVPLIARAGERRVLLTIPGSAGQLTATTLLDVLRDGASPEELVVVSAVGFDTGTLSIADAYDIDILGPAALVSLLEPADDEAQLEG